MYKTLMSFELIHELQKYPNSPVYIEYKDSEYGDYPLDSINKVELINGEIIIGDKHEN